MLRAEDGFKNEKTQAGRLMWAYLLVPPQFLDYPVSKAGERSSLVFQLYAEGNVPKHRVCNKIHFSQTWIKFARLLNSLELFGICGI